jgi:hypothetical protein
MRFFTYCGRLLQVVKRPASVKVPKSAKDHQLSWPSSLSNCIKAQPSLKKFRLFRHIDEFQEFVIRAPEASAKEIELPMVLYPPRAVCVVVKVVVK